MHNKIVFQGQDILFERDLSEVATKNKVHKLNLADKACELSKSLKYEFERRL